MKKTSRGALGLLGAASLAVVLVGTSGRLSAAEETAEAPKPHHKHHKEAKAAEAAAPAPAPEPEPAAKVEAPAAAAAAPQLPPYFSGTNADPAKPLWPDPTGANSGVWATPAGDGKGDVPGSLSVTDVYDRMTHNLFGINFVWALVAGFLVMFMQAGFMLVETGLCRSKNAAHTASMNFMVYALGMLGFFVCGFAFMCGGLNGTAIGGPVTLGGTPTLHSMLTFGSAINGDHGWGFLGTTGFFLTGNGYDAAAIVLFLFMMVFMDTTATIVTGACAERWSFKSFCLFSVIIGGFIYPVFGGWVWG